MINRIIDGITAALVQEFGESYKIYTESTEQGMETPCFFVDCISQKAEREQGSRWKCSNEFSIQYHPVTEEPKRECNTVRERLFAVLEYVETADGKLEGTKLSSEEADGSLKTLIHYDCYVYRKAEEVISMEELEMKGGLKN